MIEIKVDFDRCDANGTCTALLPDTFQIADDGQLEQLNTEIEDSRADELDEVIACCPVGAISRS